MKKAKTQVVTVWMGRRSTKPIVIVEQGTRWETSDIILFTKKGTKEDWEEQDWPPVKVKVTAKWEVDE